MNDQLLDQEDQRPAGRRRLRLTPPMSVLRQIAGTRAMIESSRNDALADFTGSSRSGS